MPTPATQHDARSSPRGAAPAPVRPPPPPGWPVTDRPLTIAMLGWARLSSQALEGSGYNLSASELARGLAMSGHRVRYLAAGMTYRVLGGARVRHREDWGGVSCFDLVNSPNLSTGYFNFRNPAGETACPAEAALVVRWLDEIGAEVVHVHSLEGYGLDTVAAVRASGRPVVVTPHNYWFVCPQVDLLYREESVCTDYDGGRRCESCMPGAPDPRKTKLTRRVGQSLEYALGHARADAIRKRLYGLRPGLRDLLRGRLLHRWTPPVLNPERLVDEELGRGFGEAGGQRPRAAAGAQATCVDPSGSGPGPAAAGLISHDLPLFPHEAPRDYEASPIDQNERMLANGRGGTNVHLRVLNGYGRRRAAGVEALAAASLVIPPSDFLRKVHVSMGVPEEKTRWVRLGQPHFDQINRRARRSPFYGLRPWDPAAATRPLRFAFYGTVRPNKGLESLARAIPLLAREVRQRCQFIIRAGGNEWPFRKRLSLYPEVSVYGAYDLYQLISGGGEYDVGILPHIWFENSPLVMLEHLHAGKFVLASRLGGPPDWVSPPSPPGFLGNGLLYPGGDPAGLAGCIARVVTGEVTIPSPKEVHAATVLQSYPGHIAEVESIYREVLAPPSPLPPAHGDGAAAADPAGRSDSARENRVPTAP